MFPIHNRFPKEMPIIGRLLVDYGELELRLDELRSGGQRVRLKRDDEAEFLRPVRHLDMRRSVQIDYLKARLAYLTLLKSEADQSFGPSQSPA
jgi:hypothetical protein